jgi:2Fe-2S ferredoxin
MISFKVKDKDAQIQDIEVPAYISLSLMEVLKASGYPIPATCRGISQCATCHVIVLQGLDQLSEPKDAEMDTLDLLPDSDYKSRLACQTRVNPKLNNCLFEVKGTRSLICGTIAVGSNQ